jgi:hypothetical protein
MNNPRDEIDRIIESAERNAYARGWQDAVAAITDAAEQAKGHMVIPELPAFLSQDKVPTRRNGRPPSTAIKIIEQCIATTPGMKGVEVVKAAQAIDGAIKERTVRTCLRRLRLNGIIGKKNGLWYPRPKIEAINGKVAASAPH